MTSFSHRADLTPENPPDRREEAAGAAGLYVLLVLLLSSTLRLVDDLVHALLVALVLGRRGELIDLDTHDFVTGEVAEDDVPSNLGHSHELIGALHEEGDALAVERVQLGPELERGINGCL